MMIQLYYMAKFKHSFSLRLGENIILINTEKVQIVFDGQGIKLVSH